MQAKRWLAALFFLALLGAGPAGNGTIDPPPPPPAPSPPGQPPAAPPEGTNKVVDRYQECLQKMIDAGVNDNLYMRRCLGLGDKPAAPRRQAEAEALGRADVQQVIERNLPALRECYGQLLARSADFGLTPEGEVAPRFVVLPDGSIDDLTFDATSLADVGLLGCFRDRIKAWAFPRTSGTSKLGVRLSLHLSHPKGATAGIVAVTKGYPKLAGGATGLSPAEIQAVFRRSAPAVRPCYDELAHRQGGAPQVEAIADLEVGVDGRVTKVSFTEFTLADEGFRTCVSLALKRWRFPRPHGGEPVTVRSPKLVFGAPPPPARP